MAFKTSQVRSTEIVPISRLEQVAESGFSCRIEGIGLVTVDPKKPLAAHINLIIEQDGDGATFTKRVITATLGTNPGDRDLKHARVETIDILGNLRTLYFKEQPELTDPRKQLREFKNTFLFGSPLATVVRALHTAWLKTPSAQLQDPKDHS